MKLGIFAGQNKILEELIRLQKSKPGDHHQRPSSASTSAEMMLQSRASDSRLDELNAEEAASSRNMAVRSASGGATTSDSDDNLLPIVIDGSNVAFSHGNKEVFSCKGIRLCVDWFQVRGHKDIMVFVPMWRKESAKPDTPISDQAILTELEKERLLSFTPSRQAGGKRFVCHDDRYILNLAAATGAVVVSNDNYRDLIKLKPEYKKVIEEKILMYSFVKDRFLPPDDPLGRNGPTLEQFLRKRPTYSDLQPCPYGKKCTYGNKCKFFHADRVAGAPQKSISEKLKETSQQMITEVRARGNSRDSSPGAVVGAKNADSVTRTKSMQPMASTSALADKNPLCRTQSTFSRLPPQHPPPTQPWLQHPPPVTRPAPAGVQHTVSLGPHHVAVHHHVQQMASQVQDKSHSFENVDQMWNPQFMYSRPPPQLPVDTSLPPPPPRSPWKEAAEASNVNTHKQLSRQLTINPTFDPRIHHHQVKGGGIPFPPPPKGVPPPPAGTVQQTSFDHHSTVTRNASAPESATAYQYLSAAMANPMLQNQQVQPNTVTQQEQHPHLQRVNSTSDSQLHKTLSDMTLRKWDREDENEATAAVAHAAAVSPLIGASEGGIWESDSHCEPEARSKLYYHLAAIFPEDQVLAAMRAMPEETEADKICSYILALNQQK